LFTTSAKFKLCSATLRHPSRTAIMFGPWKEAKPAEEDGTEWVVRLSEDDWAALSVVLAVAHSQFVLVTVWGWSSFGLGVTCGVAVGTGEDGGAEMVIIMLKFRQSFGL
jgi:hypothetical protein